MIIKNVRLDGQRYYIMPIICFCAILFLLTWGTNNQILFEWKVKEEWDKKSIVQS